MLNSDDRLCPRIKKKPDIVVLASSHCEALWHGQNSFQVKEKGCAYKVNLVERTCS